MGANGWVTRARRVDKPWGHEEIFALVSGRFCGKVLHVKAGHALSLQYHERKDETISVYAGSARLEVGAHEAALDTVEMGPGDAVHLAPGTRHRITALTDLVLLEASTTELDDVVRLEDRYGREGTSAP
ncbi:MAG: cupin domain-containing protein [Frankia sp.]|nr:cupin domain-containing protein [Frankia sp.]